MLNGGVAMNRSSVSRSSGEMSSCAAWVSCPHMYMLACPHVKTAGRSRCAGRVARFLCGQRRAEPRIRADAVPPWVGAPCSGHAPGAASRRRRLQMRSRPARRDSLKRDSIQVKSDFYVISLRTRSNATAPQTKACCIRQKASPAITRKRRPPGAGCAARASYGATEGGVLMRMLRY
eukprot:scaffold3072_cov116-Isochrysis_galbana.AAC.2